MIVLDSVGIGEMPDADKFNDVGSNTLLSASKSKYFHMPNMAELGLFNIDGNGWGKKVKEPKALVARMTELSAGKDTTIGHWEIAGVVSKKPLPTYPDGFPADVIDEFSKATGRGVLCNKPYSGTKVIEDYGEEHMKTGDLIVYTSADSVFQIAANEEIVPLETLYEYCQKAREILKGEHAVGRVIARPFISNTEFNSQSDIIQNKFVRTANRHDYSLLPPDKTMLNYIEESGLDVIGVGKINDIFAGNGITKMVRTKNNEDGINKTLKYMDENFTGICFTNLVDYDMLYGHRNDVDGYAKALTYFDERLPEIISKMQDEDILMITADHGCDPATVSTDHSREYPPLLLYGKPVTAKGSVGTRESFADIAATILSYFDISNDLPGKTIDFGCL